MLAYFLGITALTSSDLFGSPTQDIRIHFRVYDEEDDGYIKYVAMMGRKIFTQPMTVIPYNDDSMIRKSFECKRSLIKSINADHDFQSDNHRMWNDYLTYTFYGLMYKNKPFLSFGISIKNIERYKMHLQLINYFQFERFLQTNVERLDEAFDISKIMYGEE